MNHYPVWKNTLIVFFLFISALFALPNIYGSDLAIQISGTGDYIVQDQDVKNIKNTLVNKEIDYKSIGLVNRNILIRFEDSQSQLSSKTLLKNTLSRNYVVALNLSAFNSPVAVKCWWSSYVSRIRSKGRCTLFA